MTFGEEKLLASQIGKQLKGGVGPSTIHARERLRSMIPVARQPILQRLLDEATDRVCTKELVHHIDAIYTELAQGASALAEGALSSAELAEPLLSSLAPLGTDLNGIVTLVHIAVYSVHPSLRAYTERRLFHCVFDLGADVKSLDSLGYARLFLMVLLRTPNLFITSSLPECENRLNAAVEVATELLSLDEEQPSLGKKDKNDVVNTIANIKLETKSMKKLLNKAHWDSICTDIRFYPSQPPAKHLSKFVLNLKRTCEYIAFNTDMDTKADYIHIVTRSFLNTRFQVDLLLNAIDVSAALSEPPVSNTRHWENFVNLLSGSQKNATASVAWVLDSDVICLLLALIHKEPQITQFKSLMQHVLTEGSQPENGYLLAKAVMYGLTDTWIRDQNVLGNEEGVVKVRLATMNPLFWFLYELCLQKFVSSEDLVREIKLLGGEPLQCKSINQLFDFMSAMATSLPGEYLMLALMEVMRYVKYNVNTISYMLNLYQGVLLDIFKRTVVNFSKGVMEIVCYCRQNFDWGFMTMLVHSVDAIINTAAVAAVESSGRNEMVKCLLAGGLMDYLRWKLQQMRELSHEDPSQKIYIPSSIVLAEIFSMLNHMIGTCEELLDLFETYNSQYKILNHYNVILLPLHKALELRAQGRSNHIGLLAKFINGKMPKSPPLDLKDKMNSTIGEDRDIYSYMLLNEDIETTTSHVVDIIFSCTMHSSVINAISLLNADADSLRSQIILDVLLRKFINRLVMVLNLSVPPDFCLHSVTEVDDEGSGVAPKLSMLATFTGKILGVHLIGAHCDSVYLLFRIIMEAFRKNKVFLVEFAVEAFGAIGNVLSFPTFTKMFTSEERFCKLYPQFASRVRSLLENTDATVFEISTKGLLSMKFEDNQCLRNLVDTKAKSTTGLTILKHPAAPVHELDVDQEAGSTAQKNANPMFSIVNLAANVQYKPLTMEPLWYQEQVAMTINNVSLDDLLGLLKIDFPTPPNALEIMSIMEMSINNKNFLGHVEQLVSQGFVDWLLFVIYRYVLIRGHTYFRDCIVFLVTLGGTRMMDAMIRFTAYSLNVFLKCIRSCRGNTIYRKLLSVSSGWLGAITLGRNKPLLTKHLDLKYLILYSYQNGLLTVIIPAACKLLMNVKNSKIFKLPNPWTSSLLNLLADISISKGLKSTLQFDLSMLFRNLDYVPGSRPLHVLVREVPVSDLDRSPKLGGSIWSTVGAGRVSTQMFNKKSEFQVPPITQDVRSLLKRKIVLNPKVSCLNAKWPWVDMILNSIESCYLESSQLIERTMSSCLAATRSMIINDFVACKKDRIELNVEQIELNATAMATGLATSLIMATAREQLCNLMTMRLHMQILSVLSMEPSLNDSALSNNLEQVSGFLSKDNLGFLCALVEQAALELITGCIAEYIPEWISILRSDTFSAVPDMPSGLRPNVSVDVYKRFGALVPFALTRLQKDKQPDSPTHGPVAPMGTVQASVSRGAQAPQAGDPASMVAYMNGSKQKAIPGGFRLPNFMIIPPIDNLPTSLVSCKVDEFQHRMKDAAKVVLTHPPTIPLLNSHYLYHADSSTLLLLSCLPRNNVIFTLLWSMYYMFKHAANQTECVESLVNKVMRTSQESTKGLDLVSILQEVELSLLEMVSIDCPLVVEILTNIIPSLGPARLCQFVRYRLLKTSAVDAFMSTAMDAETLCRSLQKMVLEGQWLTIDELPQSMKKLASLDPNGSIQLHMSNGSITVDYGELYRRLSTHGCGVPMSSEIPMKMDAAQMMAGKDRMMAPGLMPVIPAPGLTVQHATPGARHMPPMVRQKITGQRLRSLRQLVLDNTFTRNKMVVKIVDIPGKERHIKAFKDRLMNVDTDYADLAQSFTEHPPDAFLTCSLICAIHMSFEPIGTEFKCDRLPQQCHDNPIWSYCDSWALMVAGMSRHESFILHKALHLMLGLMQHGLAFVCFERIVITLMNELENNLSSLVSIGHFLTLCGPSEIPEFGEHWVNIITRKQFVQQIIQNPNEWPLYHHLLVEAVSSPHSKLPNISFTLLMLLQKAPEFLCGYYLSLCDAVPPRAMQLRNMLTSAVPRSIKLPNPIIIDDHADIPSLNFTNHIMTVLRAEGLKVATDMFINEPNDALIPVILKELRVMDHTTFDVMLANHYVLYLVSTMPGILKKIPTSSQRAHNSLILLEKIMFSCISQARHMLLSCMTNHMRYPNVSTFAFIGFILRLFNKGDQALQEQITLSLLERLLISRPHPWGVLHLLFQLVKNPKYDFWNRIEAAPEVEKHIRRIIQSCANTKGTPPTKPFDPSENVTN
ncbi:ccr4-not transcription complex subunit 1 [Babesia gibsoni]|uniref:Ccr4-not transcription complex subunit 1 n=1 Tax=Babesia gibsoni TaxID=33632 RepID=A0AAD8LL71_BABGI|nr:ccr4-not transcription complex subunit 1 [Babesia gibsoni]